MKKLSKVLLSGALLFPVISLAQVSTSVMPRNAVVEEWTGIHCGYCPIGHATVQAAIDNNLPLAVLDGSQIDRMADAVAGKPFVGTRIEVG